MAKIQFENGKVVEFEGNPTSEDIEHVASQLGGGGNQIHDHVAPASAPSSLKPTSGLGFGGLIGSQFAPSDKDIAAIAAQAGSSYLGGIPQMAAQNPLSGIPGMGARIGYGAAQAIQQAQGGKVAPNLPSEPNFFPEPQSDQGKLLAGLAGIGASFMNPLGEAAQTAGNQVTQSFAGKLMNMLLKPKKSELQGAKNLGQEAVQSGLTGSLKGMSRKIDNSIQALEPQVDQMLKDRSEQVNIKDIASSMDSLKEKYVTAADDASVNAIEKMQKALTDKGEMIPVSKANLMKKQIYNVLKDRDFNNPDPKGMTEARRFAASQLKQSIENAVPDLPIKNVNQQLSLNYRLQDALATRQAHLAGKTGISPMEIIAALFEPTKVVLPLALGHFGFSAPVVSNVAQGLYKAGKTGLPGILPGLLAAGGQQIGKNVITSAATSQTTK